MDFVFRKNDLDKEDLKNLRRDGSLNVDLETTGLDPRASEIKLCQIHSNFTRQSFLIKIEENNSIPINIKTLLSYADEVIFHHAMFDMSFLYFHWKCIVSNPKCTKIASKVILSNRNNHSLKPLLKDILGVEISKKQQRSDWASSELSDEQIEYALNDVLYLRTLLKEIEQQGNHEQLMQIKNSFEYLNTRLILELKGISDVFTC